MARAQPHTVYLNSWALAIPDSVINLEYAPFMTAFSQKGLGILQQARDLSHSSTIINLITRHENSVNVWTSLRVPAWRYTWRVWGRIYTVQANQLVFGDRHWKEARVPCISRSVLPFMDMIGALSGNLRDTASLGYNWNFLHVLDSRAKKITFRAEGGNPYVQARG